MRGGRHLLGQQTDQPGPFLLLILVLNMVTLPPIFPEEGPPGFETELLGGGLHHATARSIQPQLYMLCKHPREDWDPAASQIPLQPLPKQLKTH